MQCIVAIGANLGNPAETFERAISLLTSATSQVRGVSPFYWTKPLVHPLAPASQSAYLNGALLLEVTTTSPEDVLHMLLDIERQLGRDRATELVPWGPRIIDLDLIAADALVVASDFLHLPHPRMHSRDFVLVPMQSLVPQWRHPLLGRSLTELIEALDDHWIIERYVAPEMAQA